MGMAAGTDEAQDTDVMTDRGATDEVNEGASIVGMDLAGAFPPAARTGLKPRLESSHEGIKQRF